MSYQNYSCNNNQNYFVQDRSTSRVSQPPGGGSSFSIGGGNFSDASSGGGGGKLAAGHRMDNRDPSPVSEKQVYQNQYANQLQQQISQRNSLQYGEGQPQSFGRHSRDPSPMRMQQQQNDVHYEIPGLENHYQSRGQGQAGGARDPSPMSDKQIYASQLKQQIDDKKSFQSVSPRLQMQNGRSGSGGSVGSIGGGGGRGIADMSSDAADEKYEKAMNLYRAGAVSGVSSSSSSQYSLPNNSQKKEMGGKSGPSPPPHLQRRGQEATAKPAEPMRGKADGVAMRGNGRGQGGGGGKATGSGSKAAQNETQEPPRSSINVAMPPGGRSSLSLGWN